MPYIVGFKPRGIKGMGESEGPAETAADAWKLVQDLERSDEIVTYIQSPSGGIMLKGELEYLAKRERDDADRT